MMTEFDAMMYACCLCHQPLQLNEQKLGTHAMCEIEVRQEILEAEKKATHRRYNGK